MIPLLDYPIEYIEGKVTFFGRDYIVTPDVLIPRLETESLVRRARSILKEKDENSKMGFGGGNLSKNSSTKNNIQEEFSSGDQEQLKDEQSKEGTSFSSPNSFGTFATKSTENSVGKIKTIVIDIGCGSGIIGTSVADLADEVIFLDISPAALAVTEANFRTHYGDKKAQFIVSDLLSALPISSLLAPSSSVLFLTNLPYIKADDWIHMSADTVHEPKLALFGGEKTGFEMYERLFQELSQLPSLLGEGLGVRCLFEFGFDQRQFAEQEMQKYPQWEYSFFADYAGIERFGEIYYS